MSSPMASHADTGFLVDSQVGVYKIHFKRVDEYSSNVIRTGSTPSCQGIDSGPAGLFRIDRITKYTDLTDTTFNCSNISFISQHNLVLACSEGFDRSYRKMADSGSAYNKYETVSMDFYFFRNRLAYGDDVT